MLWLCLRGCLRLSAPTSLLLRNRQTMLKLTATLTLTSAQRRPQGEAAAKAAEAQAMPANMLRQRDRHTYTHTHRHTHRHRHRHTHLGFSGLLFKAKRARHQWLCNCKSSFVLVVTLKLCSHAHVFCMHICLRLCVLHKVIALFFPHSLSLSILSLSFLLSFSLRTPL